MRFNRKVGSRPLPRIIAICRFLSALCKIAFAIMALWGIAVLGLICYSLATSNFDNGIPPLGLAVPVLYALYSVDACFLPILLGRILDDISKGRTPFTLQNARRLLLLALVLLLYAIIEAISTSVDSQFVLSFGSNMVEVGMPSHDLASNSGTTLNLFPLLMSAMFFALSYVFKYGVLLQQESDETL